MTDTSARASSIPYGQESCWLSMGLTPLDLCGDCGVPLGGYHHPLCCVAECEHGQMLACPDCQP